MEQIPLKTLVDSLYVIKGVVRGMHRTERRFDDFAAERSGAAGAALGTAITGNAAGAVGGMQSLAHKGPKVTYFSCDIGNVAVSGHFQLPCFEDGDEVEAVVSTITVGGGSRCVVVARPADKVIWTGGCGQGSAVVRKERILFLGGIFGFLYGLSLIGTLFSNTPGATKFVAGVVGLGVLGMAVMFYFTKPETHKEVNALEQRSFELLGFENPKQVDISKNLAFVREELFAEDMITKRPLCYDAFKYDEVRILPHEAVDAEAALTAERRKHRR